MTNIGYARYILKSSEGYIRSDGTVTPDPNEAFHGNINNVGTAFERDKIINMIKATQYTGDPKDVQVGSFINWPNLISKEKRDILVLRNVDESDSTYLDITEDDIYF